MTTETKWDGKHKYAFPDSERLADEIIAFAYKNRHRFKQGAVPLMIELHQMNIAYLKSHQKHWKCDGQRAESTI